MSWNATLWIGAGLIAIGAALAWRQHLWLRSARIAPATVIEMVVSRTRKGGRTYKPLVRFKAYNNSTYECLGSIGSSSPGFSVGDSLTVAYDAQSYEGRILTFGERFGFPAILIVIGLSLLLLTVTFIVGRQFVPRIYLQQSSRPGEQWQ